MRERITELVLDEGKWLFAAMLVSLIAVVALIGIRRRTGSPRRIEILRGMNLFYGCMIGIMAFGHLLAVTVKVGRGELRGSLWVLLPLGFALAVPAWWLAIRAARLAEEGEAWRRSTAALNAWLGIALLALGLLNAPLALPAV